MARAIAVVETFYIYWKTSLTVNGTVYNGGALDSGATTRLKITVFFSRNRRRKNSKPKFQI